MLLFIPFAFGLRLAGVPRWRAFAIAAGTSLAIELLQWHVIVGRDASLGDLLTNSAGGAVGIVLAERWRALVFPAVPEARRVAWWWLAGVAIALAATSWGERTSLPHTIYWGQWKPELLYMDRFPGTLVRSSVGSFPFPRGAMGNSGAFRSLLLSDSALVTAEVIPGGRTARIAPIVSVFDWQRTEIFLLGQKGADLVFSIRTNAARSLVRNPAIRLRGAFSAGRGGMGWGDGGAMTVRGGVVDRSLVAEAERGGVRREWRVPLTPGLGWSFFLPFDYAFGPETPWLSALWLAGLFLPLGYWGARVARERRETGGAMVAAAALALAVAGPLAGERAAAWWEWGGALAGALAGVLLWARLRRAAALTPPDGVALDLPGPSRTAPLSSPTP
ncbi:MAG TPA: VanZ family protein [Gemmatimonadaceae bacterium]|nr:VanZ family protein [Gemmatimonadaceae bacterium]